MAQEYNLYQHVRFNSDVSESRWDDETKKWHTKVTQASGSKEAQYQEGYTITSDFLVSAVGQLNVPKWPEIAGIDSFSGKTMHSARWDWSYDCAGKKVAMLGSGMSTAVILIAALLTLRKDVLQRKLSVYAEAFVTVRLANNMHRLPRSRKLLSK